MRWRRVSISSWSVIPSIDRQSDQWCYGNVSYAFHRVSSVWTHWMISHLQSTSLRWSWSELNRRYRIRILQYSSSRWTGSQETIVCTEPEMEERARRYPQGATTIGLLDIPLSSLVSTCKPVRWNKYECSIAHQHWPVHYWNWVTTVMGHSLSTVLLACSQLVGTTIVQFRCRDWRKVPSD